MEERYSINEDVRHALETVRGGGVILYPTDTVWGIGCDARCEEAVRRIFGIKRRPDAKSMISLVDSIATLERWVKTLPETAGMLIEAAVDPLTIIYSSPTGLAPSLLAPDGSAGLRITSERISRELCRRLRAPLVSTSANISGAPTPLTFGEIAPELLEAADYVMQGGRDYPAGRPSAIIKVADNGVLNVIR